MKTSQISILSVMVLVLGAMAFIYLTEEKEREYKLVSGQSDTSLHEEENRSMRAKELQMSTRQIEDQTRIAQLEKENLQLKTELQTLQEKALEDPSYTLTGGGKNTTQVEALLAEIERLKAQIQMSNVEGSLIVKDAADKKVEEFLLEEAVLTGRAVGKVGAVNTEHNFVIVEPIGQPNFNTSPGKQDNLLVRRDGKLLLKLTIDYMDSSDGNYVANIDSSESRAAVDAVRQGDEIILAPKLSAEEQTEPVKELPEVPLDFGGKGGDNTATPDLPDVPPPSLPEPPVR